MQFSVQLHAFPDIQYDMAALQINDQKTNASIYGRYTTKVQRNKGFKRETFVEF